jgi:hypothetical protein
VPHQEAKLGVKVGGDGLGAALIASRARSPPTGKLSWGPKHVNSCDRQFYL